MFATLIRIISYAAHIFFIGVLALCQCLLVCVKGAGEKEIIEGVEIIIHITAILGILSPPHDSGKASHARYCRLMMQPSNWILPQSA
jgi:hypothetical protein